MQLKKLTYYSFNSLLIQIRFFMKKTILATALMAVISLFSLEIYAQGTITGKVIDSNSNEALVGATVVVEGTSRGVPTNLDGSFSLEIPAGESNIVFSYIGYITK